MTPTLRVSTRKGLFTIKKTLAATEPGGWSIARTDFLGDNVTLSFFDASSGTLYAALAHGHFGAKLHRVTIGKDADEQTENSSDAGERNWREIAVPQYPKRPEGVEPPVDEMGQIVPDSLKLIWALEAGGAECAVCQAALSAADDVKDLSVLDRRNDDAIVVGVGNKEAAAGCVGQDLTWKGQQRGRLAFEPGGTSRS